MMSITEADIISEYSSRGTIDFLKWWNAKLYTQIESERASLQGRLSQVRDNEREKEVLEAEIRGLENWLGLITKWFARNKFSLPPSSRSKFQPSVDEVVPPSVEDTKQKGGVSTTAGCTLNAFCREYVEHVKTNMAPKTVENLERVMKSFVDFIGEKSPSHLTLLDVERYKQARKGKVSDSTINIDVRTLKAAMQVAVKWGKIAANPFQEAKNIRVTQRAKSHLTDDELTKLLGAIKEDWYKKLVRFALLTGLRRGEILDLQQADFDSKTGVITIQSSDTNRVKGGKIRKIPLQQEAIDIISGAPGTSQWVFTDGKGNRIAEDLATKKFKKYAKDAGLSGDIHFHSLRHTFATIASNNGMTPNILKAIMGHSSLKTTEGYIGSDTDTMREQMKKVSIKEEVPKGKEVDKNAAQGLAENE